MAAEESVMDNYTGVVLDYFEKISAVPRGSGSEAGIRSWLEAWAESRGFESKTDATGNLLVTVPGSEGMEAAEPLVLQSHMDMVCEKEPDSGHDFGRDPIRLVREDEWIHADGTTLGADNGMGIALSLTAATGEALRHPPLELLFTVDEETGLTGAKGLTPGFFHGRTLLNIDSEDEGVFTVGCAGGRNTEIVLTCASEEAPVGFLPVTVTVSGLSGGHSGVDINKVRGNANTVLVRLLLECVRDAGAGVRLSRLKGGSAHNAIARDASALLFCSERAAEVVERRAADLELRVREELGSGDPSPAVRADRAGNGAADGGAAGRRVVAAADAHRLLQLLHVLPHGVRSMSPDIPGLVQTSTNLATVATAPDGPAGGVRVSVLTSQRSSVMSELEDIGGVIEDLARLAGGETGVSAEYPAWQPNMASALLRRSTELYRSLFGKDAVVEAVHAGLECGVIGAVKPGMDMISLGATIRGAHSPRERLFVPSIGKVFRFLSELIASYGA